MLGVDASVELQVVAAEDSLLEAMVAGDTARVDALTADDVVFTAPGGATIGKAEDLAAYTSGTLRITEVTVVHRQVVAHAATGQTKMLAEVTVKDGDDVAEVTLEWVRHWELRGDSWLLVAATTALQRRAAPGV